MKRITIFAILSGLLLLLNSCKNDSEVKPSKIASTNPKEKSLSTTFAPEELYISENNQMYAIDNSSGSGYVRNSDEPYTYAMAYTGGYIYAVMNNEYFPTMKPLVKIDVTQASSEDLTPGVYWNNTNIMTALNGFIYIVDGPTLWKVDATTGTKTTLGRHDWQDAEAITALGNYVYIVDDGLLWKVNINTGAASTLGNGTWWGIPAMTAYGNFVYAVDDGLLWRVNVNSGLIETFGTGSWETTKAMTSLNGYLYAVDADLLWKVNTFNGAISNLTPPGYSWGGSYIEMAARK